MPSDSNCTLPEIIQKQACLCFCFVFKENSMALHNVYFIQVAFFISHRKYKSMVLPINWTGIWDEILLKYIFRAIPDPKLRQKYLLLDFFNPFPVAAELTFHFICATVPTTL